MSQDSSGRVGGVERTVHLAEDFKWFLSNECKKIRGTLITLEQYTQSDLL